MIGVAGGEGAGQGEWGEQARQVYGLGGSGEDDGKVYIWSGSDSKCLWIVLVPGTRCLVSVLYGWVQAR